MKEISLDYIAGLFDGEGYITVNKKKKSFVPVVGIKMNGFNLLKTLHNQFGGYFYQRKNYINRPLTEWTLRGAFQVIPFLKKIESFLVIKKEQAQLCLELCNTFSIRKSNGDWVKKIKLNQNIIDVRNSFKNQIKQAKTKVL
jgi:hypothetical protein